MFEEGRLTGTRQELVAKAWFVARRPHLIHSFGRFVDELVSGLLHENGQDCRYHCAEALGKVLCFLEPSSRRRVLDVLLIADTLKPPGSFDARFLDLVLHAESALPMNHPARKEIDRWRRRHPLFDHGCRLRGGRASVRDLERTLHRYPTHVLDLLEIAGKSLNPVPEEHGLVEDLYGSISSQVQEPGQHWKRRCIEADALRLLGPGAGRSGDVEETLNNTYRGIIECTNTEAQIRYRNALIAILKHLGEPDALDAWAMRVISDFDRLQPHQLRYTAGVLTHIAPTMSKAQVTRIRYRLLEVVRDHSADPYKVKTALKQLVQISPPGDSWVLEPIMDAMGSSESLIIEQAMQCLLKRPALLLSRDVAMQVSERIERISRRGCFSTRSKSFVLAQLARRATLFADPSCDEWGGIRGLSGEARAFSLPHLGGMSRVVKVLVVRDERVLLLKKQGDGGAMRLTLPGGKPEAADEPIQSVARRELIEEIGLSVEVEELLPLSFQRVQGKWEKYNQFVYLVCKSDAVAIDLSRNPDHGETFLGVEWRHRLDHDMNGSESRTTVNTLQTYWDLVGLVSLLEEEDTGPKRGESVPTFSCT